MKRKRLWNISKAVQAQIVAEYKEKLPNGNLRYRLTDIARMHEVSLSTVNNIARAAGCQDRPRGRRLALPSARVLKILRDASTPGISYRQVGVLNPRLVTNRSGKRVRKPLSKQRVKQIIDFWQDRGNPGLRSRGFSRGDEIEWDGRLFTVVRYDSARQGAVIERSDGKLIDPFVWNFKGAVSRLVRTADEVSLHNGSANGSTTP